MYMYIHMNIEHYGAQIKERKILQCTKKNRKRKKERKKTYMYMYMYMTHKHSIHA